MVDIQYARMIQDILENGSEICTRNSKVIRKINLTNTFESTPLVSIRKTAWKSSLLEWEWFLSGSNNLYDLDESVRHWWKPFCLNAEGSLHHNYGVALTSLPDMYTSGETINQITSVIDGIKDRPYSRRNVITTWIPEHVHVGLINPTNCHGTITQFFVNPSDNSLDMIMFQRSGDVVLGVPHNMIQYWAFLMYVADKTGTKVGSFIHTIGDAHIYEEHVDMANMIVKGVLEDELEIDTPELEYTPTSDKFLAKDFKLIGEYNPQLTSKIRMVV